MRNLKRSNLLTAVVLFSSLALSLLLWQLTVRQLDHRIYSEFDSHAHALIAHLERRLSAHVHLLQGIRAFFDSSSHVSRNAFNNYVSSLELEHNYPGIQGLSYTTIFAAADRDAHIASMRRQGFPDYSIHPPGDREIYMPVIYMQPHNESNARVIGYDSYVETIRRATLDKARDSGRATISGKVTLVQETNSNQQAGFLMFLPVYQPGARLDSIEQRRNNLKGYINAAFRMNDFMAGAGTEHSVMLDYQIYDGNDISNITRMYGNGVSTSAQALAEHTIARHVEFADHTWTLVFHPSAHFLASIDRSLPGYVAASGLAFSLLLTLLANAYLRTKIITRELRKNEERWRYALEGVGDGVWDWHIKSNEVNYSPQWKAALGYADNEITNDFSEWERRLHPDERQHVLDAVQAHIEGKTDSFTNEHRLKHKDGSWKWVLGRGLVISRDENGKPLRMIGTLADITKRKKAEQELREQRDFNNSVLETAGNVIVIIDINGNITQFNRAAEELTGFSREEVVGQPVWEWVIPQEQMDGVKNVFNNLVHGDVELARHYENDWLTKSGGRRTLDWHNTILTDENGKPTHIVALGYDVTERKKTEQQLKDLNATLEARVADRTRELSLAKDIADSANRAKSNFLSNMSHEIRSPLGAIIGFSESLKNDDFDQQERDKIISTIVRNGKHLQQIINDILDLSKIEADQLETEMIDTSIFQVIGEVDSLQAMTARDKGLEFKIKYVFPLPETIVTDPVCLKQILVNLCSNAIKFTNQGSVSIEISSEDNFKHIRFTVADTGIGMTREERERIFDPFSQADTSTTRKYGGTGLGLSISNNLASALDGTLDCISEKDKGSVFTLTITNHASEPGKVINHIEDINSHHEDQRFDAEIKPLNGSILLVEDSPDNQQLVSMYIRKTGARLSVVENGRLALDLAQQQDFDLILMDMQMPVMDGLEAIKRLRASGYSKPIVSLTANAMLSDREKCEAAGADDYLVKPIELVQFYRVLNRYMPEDKTAAMARDSAALEQEMHSSPKYLAMVERFKQHLPVLVEELKHALADEDWTTLQHKSHDLKGMGGAMGFPEITEKAAQLNTLVKQKRYDDLAVSTMELELACQAAGHGGPAAH